MKTRVRCWAGLVLTAMCIGLCVGCTNQGQQATDNGLAEGDSLVYSINEANMECKVYAQQPEERLRLAVGEWLDEQLGGYYRGDATDLRALVDFYGKSITDTLRSELTDLPEGVIVEYDARMEKVFETDKVVTYTLQTFINLGGAHPSSGEQGVTFRKSDGRRLTWDIVRHRFEYDFNEVLKESLKAYFNAKTDKDLEQMLFDGNNIYGLPLPKTPPFFMENGVGFIYQQYEIAAYAMGMPGDTIPYERIKPFMTEWAKRLIP